MVQMSTRHTSLVLFSSNNNKKLRARYNFQGAFVYVYIQDI